MSRAPGDNIVAANNLYGGTYELLHYTFPKLGGPQNLSIRRNLEGFKKAIDSHTAPLCGTIGNPKLDVPISKPWQKLPTMPASPSL